MFDSKVTAFLSGYRMLVLGDSVAIFLEALSNSGATVLARGVDWDCSENPNQVDTKSCQTLESQLSAQTEFDSLVLAIKSSKKSAEIISNFLRRTNTAPQTYIFFVVLANDAHNNDLDSASLDRSLLEQHCFAAGYRKHPAYYTVVDYESLANDSLPYFVPMERIPSAALLEYPIDSLEEERGLHMDMTRDTGERSDAHIIRYQWACSYIKPGDRVLDAACGLGYGSHVMRHLTHASQVVGVDGSDYAIDYATKSFPSSEGRAEYIVGMLPDKLREFPDGAFDVIVSFETLEHVEQPTKLLQEFFRLLSPGGRVIVSVPNDWSDETGEDPNPYHLHVYDWNRLKTELSASFILEDAYAQTASQCKVSDKGGIWERRPRSLNSVALLDNPPQDCEWWLMTAMKSPLEGTQPYQEKVFANIASSGHPSIRYTEFFQNPWLMYAMVNSSYRQKNPVALEALANSVMASMPDSTNDYAAALCVKAYSVLGHSLAARGEIEGVLSKIEQITSLPPKDPMRSRWKVSLLFVKGKLLHTLGHMEKAKEAFIDCAAIDVREFGIHLATKTTEALYLAGKIAHMLGDERDARLNWQNGIAYGDVLLGASLDDILISREHPNRFNHGDGIREYTVAWDNIARCANGIHLLNRGGNFDYLALDNCHQTEYRNVSTDLHSVRRTLRERTRLLEPTSKELQVRTHELVDTREILIERTELLERASKDLQERTQELVNTRQILAERTERLEFTSKDLQERTQELVDTRQTLAERTERLELTSKNLQVCARELLDARQTIAERTERLERTSGDLLTRTQELENARRSIAERTERLELSSKELQERTQELADTRRILAERTSNGNMIERELEETQRVLAERTCMLDQTAGDLRARDQELQETSNALSEISDKYNTLASMPFYKLIFQRIKK